LISRCYTFFYSLALQNGVTHGVLTTLLGIQPILASFLTKRRVTAAWSTQLTWALTGLTVVVPGGLVRCVSPRRDPPAPALRLSGFRPA
jgi:hypothetical protein